MASPLTDIKGLTRSLGREMRRGATTNGIMLSDGVEMTAPAAQAALRFFLSGRSAYVAGQFVTVSSSAGSIHVDWDAPLAHKVIVVSCEVRGVVWADV